MVDEFEGVPQLVSLAVKDQMRGLISEDRPEQLQERLECLPSEVEGVHLRLLLQTEKPYEQDTSWFRLQVTFHKLELSLSEHTLASYKALKVCTCLLIKNNGRGVVSLYQSTWRRTIATYAGLLEVYEHPGWDMSNTCTSDCSSEMDPQQLDDDPDDTMSGSSFESGTRKYSSRGQEIGQPNPEPDSEQPRLQLWNRVYRRRILDLE